MSKITSQNAVFDIQIGQRPLRLLYLDLLVNIKSKNREVEHDYFVKRNIRGSKSQLTSRLTESAILTRARAKLLSKSGTQLCYVSKRDIICSN